MCSPRFWKQPNVRLKLCHTPVVVASLFVVALAILCVATPVWIVFGMTLKLDIVAKFMKCLEWSSWFHLVVWHVSRPLLQATFPDLLPNTTLFFDAMAVKDQEVSERLAARPLQAYRIMKARLFRNLKTLVIVLTLLGPLAAALVVFAAPLIGAVSAVVASVIAALIALGPVLLIGGAFGLVVIIAVLGFCGYVMTLLSPFVRMFRYDPPLGVVLVAAALYAGLVNVSRSISFAVQLYYTVSLLTADLLVDYHERLDDGSGKEWEEFVRKNRWRMVGYGLPLWGIMLIVHPFWFIAGLQLFQGAASVLLLDTLDRKILLEGA